MTSSWFYLSTLKYMYLGVILPRPRAYRKVAIQHNHLNSLAHSRALQPMQGFGRLKKSPRTISALTLHPPISKSQPLCIPHHSVNPSEVWPSHSPSALRLVQGDFLTWQIILHSYYMSCPSKRGYPNCCYQISLVKRTIQFFIVS